MSNIDCIVDHLENNGFFYRIAGFFNRIQVEEEETNAFLTFLHNIDVSMPAKMMRVKTAGTYDSLMDWKKNAGASSYVSITKDSHLKLSSIPGVNSNVRYPKLRSGSLHAWFTPDGIIVKETAQSQWSVFEYSDIEVEQYSSRRLIDGKIYKDTKVVDHTWKYVNKKGGPDKRFKDNKKLPIVQYGEVVFSIGNHVFDFCSSSVKGAENFGETLKIAKKSM